MGELLDDPRSRHLLQMTTWFAELDSEALHLADAEPFANETVDVHVAHGDLPSSLSGPESNVLDDLGCNERQRLAWRRSVGMEMTVPFDSLPGDGPHGVDRPQRWLARSSEMDRLHRHGSIMHEPSVESIAQGSFPNTGPVQELPVRRTVGSRPGLGSRSGRLERTRAS